MFRALPTLVALVNASAFGCCAAPTSPRTSAGQDSLSVASLRLKTTELGVVNPPQAMELSRRLMRRVVSVHNVGPYTASVRHCITLSPGPFPDSGQIAC